MKYLVILGDGMSDHFDEQGLTPLIEANKPCIDLLAQSSAVGLCKTIPDNLSPGSDTANLSVLGYDPLIYYTGRSPLEAISMGIKLEASDVTYRLNLVTLSDEEPYENKKMLDYSAGDINSAEAEKLIELLKPIAPKGCELFSGISYRHCMVRRCGDLGGKLTPPHDITGKEIKDYLPKGEFAVEINEFMRKSNELLRGKHNPTKANSAWLWGEGKKPALDNFEKKFGIKGAMISAVDLLKGIAIGAGMQSIDVSGATGTIDTDYGAKVTAAKKAFETVDYVYLHIEAPDEAGHQGNRANKIRAIELIDEKVVKPICAFMPEFGDYKILITPDHATPLHLKTHTHDPVPFLLFDSRKKVKGASSYNEKAAKSTGMYLANSGELSKFLLS